MALNPNTPYPYGHNSDTVADMCAANQLLAQCGLQSAPEVITTAIESARYLRGAQSAESFNTAEMIDAHATITKLTESQGRVSMEEAHRLLRSRRLKVQAEADQVSAANDLRQSILPLGIISMAGSAELATINQENPRFKLERYVQLQKP